MTAQEAIEKLSWHSSTNGCGKCTDAEHKEAKRVAIKALKKQDSQKVEKTILHFDGNHYKCPVCEELLSYDQKYCDECGQRLDWSEVKQ